MSNENFCTVFNCMDGRTQDIVSEFIRKNYGDSVYVDTLTLPGMDRQLAEEGKSSQVTYLKDTMAPISSKKHGSNLAVIVGHEDCAGNPVSKDEHFEHLKRAVKQVFSWGLFEEVLGVYVGGSENPADWKVSIVVQEKIAN